jgi:hypothetical protein
MVAWTADIPLHLVIQGHRRVALAVRELEEGEGERRWIVSREAGRLFSPLASGSF